MTAKDLRRRAWTLLAGAIGAAGYGLAVWYAFRQLDGMSGDVSGFALTLGELAGLAFLFLTRYYL